MQRIKILFTCIKKSILESSTSSASLFLIMLAESRSKCWTVSFSCSGRLQLCWSQLKASLNWLQVIHFPPILRHLGLPFLLLFWILFLIFLMLCCWKDVQFWNSLWNYFVCVSMNCYHTILHWLKQFILDKPKIKLIKLKVN